MLTINPGVPVLVLTMVLAAPPVIAQDEQVATTFDKEWITLNGEVEAILATSFTLDYGEDDITVEMDAADLFDDKKSKRTVSPS